MPIKNIVNRNAYMRIYHKKRYYRLRQEAIDFLGGKCVKCASTTNLHFDHELPFSKGGTSLTAKNVRLLCMKHNLEKSAKIE